MFLIFFLLGEGEGRVRSAGGRGGIGFLVQNPRKGGGFPGAGGAEGLGGCLWRIGEFVWLGGLYIF